MFSRMRATAFDMAGPGFDARTGYGFIAGNKLLVSCESSSSSFLVSKKKSSSSSSVVHDHRNATGFTTVAHRIRLHSRQQAVGGWRQQ